MKYQKESLDHIKKITDTFIQSVTHNSAQPIDEYYTPIENEHAVNWLNKNIITYDEWLKKNQL